MSSGAGANNRWRLTESEGRKLREFVTAMMLNGQVTADAAGLHPVDLYALNVLDLDGPATAGEIADRTGLTSGAVTKLVDRLTGADLVERTEDPRDRRRVVLRIVAGPTVEALGGGSAPLFTPIARRMDTLITSFPGEQRGVLSRFLTLATEQLQEATDELQQSRRGGRRGPAGSA